MPICQTKTDSSHAVLASKPSTKTLMSMPTVNSVWWVRRARRASSGCRKSHRQTVMSYEQDAKRVSWWGENFTRRTAYVWPSIRVSSWRGFRTSQILIDLSTEPVASMNSLYLFQSHVSISISCPGITKVDRGWRTSHTRTVQSPEAEAKMSACRGFQVAL